MGALALRVTDGAKSYHRGGREETIFHDVDLTVEEREILALLGPSGCGKSTLLRAIAGLDPLTSGKIEVSSSDEGDPTVGMVFQDALLLPWLTVAENVALGLRYRANRHARDTETVDQILEDFGLSRVGRSYPSELSGGQAQRTSLARTVITRPRVLLLDEPFASLDPRTRTALGDWLVEVTHARGLTVVIVTHDVDEALFLGDRVALMSPRPGTVMKRWEARHEGSATRSRTVDRAVRDEILSMYQTDVGLGVGAGSYSI